MNDPSDTDIDEFISQELGWLGKFLRKHFKLTKQEIRRKIRERLDVTI